MPSAARAVESVDNAVTKLRLEYRNKGFRENCSTAVRIGLFGNLVGAEVTVEQRINVGQHDHGASILHAFVVTCTGFGCTDPDSAITTRDLIFDCDHGDITEEGRLTARKQAQAHAEVCRALPRATV